MASSDQPVSVDTLLHDGIPVVVAQDIAALAAAGINQEALLRPFRVVIPSGVTAIHPCAFNLRSIGLTSVTIPDGVQSIEWAAFSDCTELTSVNIPEGVTMIGDSAFSSTGLTSVIIPKGVNSIGCSAFSGCSNLSVVTIHEGITEICDDTFSDCTALTSMTIPNGVTCIRSGAFFCCGELTSITFPDGVEQIRNGAFFRCSRLTSVTLRKGMTVIGDYAFAHCGGLTSVTLPEGVTSIGDEAFSDCVGLTSLTIPEGVTEIGNDAFQNCSSLVVLSLPGSLKRFGVRGQDGSDLDDNGGLFGEHAWLGCDRLAFVMAPPHIHNLLGCMISDCPLLERIEADTEKNRRRALQLQYWSASTHQLCSGPRREWVATVVMAARRLGAQDSGLPRLPIEMWLSILEFVPRWALGPRIQ